jgi:AcrR family transcriptional regulator
MFTFILANFSWFRYKKMNMFIYFVSTIVDMSSPVRPGKAPSIKSIETRRKIIDSAFKLFELKGYEKATMRDIAAEAKISLGLTYRYFSQKEELVLALYEQLAQNTAEECESLPKGSLAKRYPAALSQCLESLTPHRGMLSALFSAGLSITSPVSVLGEETADVRSMMWTTYNNLLKGCTDAPKGKQIDQVTTLMYAGHLITVLFWIQDRSDGQANTKKLLKFSEKGIKLARPFLRVRVVTNLLTEFCGIVQPFFGNPSQRTVNQSS